MKVEIHRHWFTRNSTSGVVKVDGVYSCFSLEDEARPDGVKIPGHTCIQPGEYLCVIDDSKRFGRPMPHLLGVTMFEGIRIHPGNNEANTEGCILVGYSRKPDIVEDSRKAFDDLFSKMQAAVDRKEQIWVIITNEPL